MSRLVLALVASLLGLPAPSHAEPLSAIEVLRRAFTNRYECDTTSRIEIRMRDAGGGTRNRVFETMSKRIDGRLRSLGRLVEPAHLRGMTVLNIETDRASEDTFVYLPTLGKVRRVTSAQRSDSFLGSDVTYEDFERRRVEDFLIDAMEPTLEQGEAAWLVQARPARRGGYQSIEFLVARRDFAILATSYFKRGSTEPFRLIQIPRGHMVTLEGHVLPTRILAQNKRRRTSTEIRITNLRVNPPLEDHLFSVVTLEQQRPLE